MIHVLFVLYYDVGVLGKETKEKVYNIKSRRKKPPEETIILFYNFPEDICRRPKVSLIFTLSPVKECWCSSV